MAILNRHTDREGRFFITFMVEAMVLSLLAAPPYLAGVAVLVGLVFALPLAILFSLMLWRKNLAVIVAASLVVDLAWLAAIQWWEWMISPLVLAMLKIGTSILFVVFTPNARLHRDGCCPVCDYPIGTSEVCTECGNSVVRGSEHIT